MPASYYVNVNPNYLSSFFQKKMGLSVREFITKERVHRAKELLATGELRIADVAEIVGIRNVKYFNRIFKKAVGTSPSEYRDKVKNGMI